MGSREGGAGRGAGRSVGEERTGIAGLSGATWHSLQAFADAHGRDSTESFQVITPDGTVVDRAQGNEHEVFATDRSKLAGNVMVHNHPNGGTLSPTDVHTAIWNNAAGVVAIGTNPATQKKVAYVVTPPAKGWAKTPAARIKQADRIVAAIASAQKRADAWGAEAFVRGHMDFNTTARATQQRALTYTARDGGFTFHVVPMERGALNPVQIVTRKGSLTGLVADPHWQDRGAT